MNSGAFAGGRLDRAVRSRTFREAVAFVAVGVLNTAFGYAVFAAAILLGLSHAASLAIATVLGVLFNFVTIGSLVFNNRDFRLLGRFIGVYVVLYLFNLGLLQAGVALGIDVLLCQAICIVPVSASSFILGKYFVFRVSGPHEADQHRHALL